MFYELTGLACEFRNTFDPHKLCPDEIPNLLTSVKGLVRYFKETRLQTLQQSCDTRWNSSLPQAGCRRFRFDGRQRMKINLQVKYNYLETNSSLNTIELINSDIRQERKPTREQKTTTKRNEMKWISV